MRTVAVNDAGLRIGQDHQNAKYTDGEVRMVIALHEDGMSYGRIANKLDMPKSTVASICRGDRRGQPPCRWKEVT